MDTLTSQERSRQMATVRSKDTKPEMIVRRLAHGLGYRYRLHAPRLPGKPDLVFTSRKKIILVHGCFWHAHEAASCKLARRPKSRGEYWNPKLEKNRERDSLNLARLEALGWEVLTLWECEIKDQKALADRLKLFLDAPRAH